VIRIVVDTNVLISAYEFGGNPARVIDKAAAGEIEIVISEPIMDEVCRILSRKLHWRPEALKELESVIGAYAKKVQPGEPVNVIKEDPADNRILECAAAGEADYIVTGDKDLLRLKRFGNISIATPAEFLRELERQLPTEQGP